MNKLNKIDVINLLESNKTVVGLNQVLKMLNAQKAQMVILAEDADDYIKNQVYNACKNSVKVMLYKQKKELGSLAGVNIGTAVIAILK